MKIEKLACPRCDAEGLVMADCTTFGQDCACNDSYVECSVCLGSGVISVVREADREH